MRSVYTLLAVLLLACAQAGCGARQAQPESNAATASAAPATPAGEADTGGPATTPEAQKLFEQGNELARQDKDAEAAEAYKQAISIDPDFAEAHLRLAMTNLVIDKKDESEEEFKKAAEAYQKFVRKNPKDARAFFNMGTAYTKIKKPDEAVKALRQAVKLDPENSTYQYELGLAYTHTAQYQESVMALQKAVELDPDNFPAQEALEKAKIDLQRWQAMVKQQEAVMKRGGPKSKNANANTPPGMPPPPQIIH